MPNLLGTSPNQIGTNADHGGMAFQDENAVNIGGGSIQADLTGNSWNQNTDISTVQPTLKLDFDKMFALDPRITFGRASTASYYDGKTFAVAEQNALINSQDFNKTGWSTASASVTPGAMIAPDGTMTATKLYAAAANAAHSVTQATTSMVATPSQATFSIHAKAGEYTKVAIADGSDARFGVTVDLSNGTLISAALGTVTPTVAISSLGGGWYRIAITCALRISAFNPNVIGYPDAGATINGYGATFTGDNASGIFIWGAQLEQRSAVSAYTPTTSSAITNYIPQLMTAAANQPRFDFDPVTGECKGFLIEEQRANLLKYSSDPTNAIWTKQANVSVLANQAVAPDGTLTAAQLTFTSASTNAIYQTITGISASTAYTFSVWLKGTAGHKINITINYSAGGQQIVTQTLTGGWDRVTATGTTSAGTTNVDVTVYSVSPNALTAFIWGAQLEAGSFATSYIPTTSAQVTRSVDIPSMSGTNFSQWFNPSEGTIVVEASGQSVYYAVGFSDGTASNQIQITGAASGTVMTVQSNGSNAADIGSRALIEKVAAAYKSRDFAASVNGGAAATSSSGAVPSGLNMLRIGQRWEGTNPINGWIKRLTYFPKRLSDAELKEMTQ